MFILFSIKKYTLMRERMHEKTHERMDRKIKTEVKMKSQTYSILCTYIIVLCLVATLFSVTCQADSLVSSSACPNPELAWNVPGNKAQLLQLIEELENGRRVASIKEINTFSVTCQANMSDSLVSSSACPNTRASAGICFTIKM